MRLLVTFSNSSGHQDINAHILHVAIQCTMLQNLMHQFESQKVLQSWEELTMVFE